MAQHPSALGTLLSFESTDGAGPNSVLVQGSDGNLYGTTYEGGVNDLGTFFKIDTSGALTTLYNFCSLSGCTDGDYPEGTLALAINGDFYGTTQLGGANGAGTVFQVDSTGTLTTLYNFCSLSGCTDGAYPLAGLIQAANGELYGTTANGGANGLGTIFKISVTTGLLRTVYSFCSLSGCTDGLEPFAGLIQGKSGDFYGTTLGGGASGNGTIFKMTPTGTLTTLHSFNGGDGSEPTAPLVQAADGDFYGTTDYYGDDAHGAAYSGGTIFKITPSGTLTTLYDFCSQIGCADGYYPVAGLMQATDGALYGTTSQGGAAAGGTVYRMTPSGTLTTVYNFCSKKECADGATPYTVPVQDTNGNLFETTFFGGAKSAAGTVFSMSIGQGPFVKTLTTSGKVGATVRIIGTDLNGAISVSFNGTAAGPIIIAATEITATVPAGATTGFVTVTMPTSTLKSNVPFQVLH
ncbi:MAG: choice-of-anchor tandem repeat GloVer-containing protein [Bryobacteraceae bacterium]